MIGIIKGDVRFTYLSMILKNSILSNELVDFCDVDVLVLPFSGINNSYIISGTEIDIRDIICNNSIKTIVSGNNNDKLNDVCQNNNIKVIYLLENDEFVRENAFLTARGVLYFEEEELARYSNDIIILGYGNIGYYLAHLLKTNKIGFAVYPRNRYERKFASLDEFKVDEDFTKYQMIINTIPSNFSVDYDLLLKKKIVELASKPYGFDMLEIAKKSIDYTILGALPSKYNPYEAAVIIKKIIEKELF